MIVLVIGIITIIRMIIMVIIVIIIKSEGPQIETRSRRSQDFFFSPAEAASNDERSFDEGPELHSQGSAEVVLQVWRGGKIIRLSIPALSLHDAASPAES